MNARDTARTVLVLLENPAAGIGKSGSELLTLARTLGEVNVLTGTGDPLDDRVATEISEFGASQLFAANSEAFNEYPVAARVQLLQQVLQQHPEITVVLADNSELQTDVLAQVAVQQNAGVLTDTIAISPELVATQAVYSGQYLVQSRGEGLTFFTVRPNSVTAKKQQSELQIEKYDFIFQSDNQSVRVINRAPGVKSNRPAIEEASAVVCAGRGVDGDLDLVEQLADALGAGLGATRAVVDNDWIEHSAQIGQTGKTIAPKLYVGIGVAGAIQHRSGIQGAEHIVAINNDPEATIFEFADLGVVGDLREVVPQILEELAKRS